MVDNEILEFKEKKYDIRVSESVIKWESVFDSVVNYSKKIINYIRATKSNYFNQNRGTFSNSKEAIVKFKNDGTDTVLIKLVIDYGNSLLKLNEQLSRTFEDKIKLFISGFFEVKTVRDYSNRYFSGINDNEFYLQLTELEGRLQNLELQLLEYCNINCLSISCGYYDEFYPISFQNSKVFKIGDRVVLETGVGAFSRQANPIIHVGSKRILVDVDGVAKYEFNAPNKIGNHRIPIKIEYTRPEGTRQVVEKEIKFDVVQ